MEYFEYASLEGVITLLNELFPALFVNHVLVCCGFGVYGDKRAQRVTRSLTLTCYKIMCVSNYNPTRLHNGDEKPRTTTKNMEPNVVLCKHIAAGFVFSAV